MSQYNAQCHQIRLAVSNIAENVNVNTVVASQGNKYLLSSDPVWKNLIYHYARLGCVVEDYEEFPRSSSNHKVPGGSMYLQSKTASNSKKYSDNRVPKRKPIKHQLTKETEEDFYKGADQEEEMHQRQLQKEELLYSRD